jgi:hypothetical protein
MDDIIPPDLAKQLADAALAAGIEVERANARRPTSSRTELRRSRQRFSTSPGWSAAGTGNSTACSTASTVYVASSIATTSQVMPKPPTLS